VRAAIEDLPGEDDASGQPAALTTVDRYYLAWTQYQSEHGAEPRAEQLAAYLAAEKVMTGRGGKPVSPSTLRRYLLPFRLYSENGAFEAIAVARRSGCERFDWPLWRSRRPARH
jgi:hypothetical protein